MPPAARAVMTNTTGLTATRIGDGILCTVVGEVITASSSVPPVGTIVMSYGLWEEFAVVPAEQTFPVVPGHPLVHNLGALGLLRNDAYRRVATGPNRCGLGRQWGCRPHRVSDRQASRITSHWHHRIRQQESATLEADYKFTGTVNHRSPTFPDDLRAACGDTGVHVFFDNVGGPLP